MTRFLVVPQWQGSPSARAMHLINGVEAIAGDLPSSATIRVEVPLEAGDAADTGVHRYSAIAQTRRLVTQALNGVTEPVMLIGGDSGVAVAAVASSLTRQPDLAVLWLAAHPALHTVNTSPSGAFAGMALRAVLGEGPSELALPTGAVPAGRAVLAGARSPDPGESEIASALGVRSVAAAELTDAAILADAVDATGAAAVHIHLDLDVLDPASMTGVQYPEPFGASTVDLVAAIGAVRERVPLAGSSIAGFAPSSPAAAIDDLGTILRLVGALA